MVKSIDRIEIEIEDLTQDIKKLTEFLEYTQDSKIETEVKRDILHRLEKEIEWLEQIREEENDALLFEDNIIFEKEDSDKEQQRKIDLLTDIAIEESIAKRHGEEI